MGYVERRKITEADRLERCDNCNREELYASGKEVKDAYKEVVLWFCFNCIVQKKVEVHG